ncbi:hypothetical protein TRFO_31971 [Tritrichomonas foetus]|uniref:Rab-GAP TBC domain-containing protein n=1 Tax=Tritrichomonas foetus TaxID=1144522 RepID=A0A1J4JUR1_9EUKA|nr:hypothetical protein TRFO_31971 [Tritrichomonas foetus]|eukprot:OHT01260.1 hypothetical protein TRFO_31971 [Tritrichomonas foetus]
MTAPLPPRRFQLCTIEPITEIVNGSLGVTGTLVLSRVEESYQLHFSPDERTLTQHITAIDNSPSKIPDGKWKINKKFRVDCGKLSTLQLHQEPLSITISRTDRSGVRSFTFGSSEFISMTELVEQLVINGIAVPAPPEQKNDKYLLYFYRRCHRNIYSYTPPHIQLSVTSNNDLEAFWAALHQFFTSLIIHLDTCDSLPKDPSYPLNIAAEACHERVLSQIREYSANISKIPVVENEIFNEKGQINNFEVIKKSIYQNGCPSKLLTYLLPFVIGVFKPDSTFESRAELMKELKTEFYQLYSQCTSLKASQIENHKKFLNAFRVIKHDVLRTDRQLPAFSKSTAFGLEILTRLLKTYCIFNPPIGYLQGMNDIFVPFILTYLPEWTPEGVPIIPDDIYSLYISSYILSLPKNHANNETNNEINNDIKSNIDEQINKKFLCGDVPPIIKDDEQLNAKIEAILPMIFWCFDAMLRNINHLCLLGDVTSRCKLIAKEIHSILMQVSPIAAIWMRRNSLDSLIWLYSDFVLLFKRSFQNSGKNGLWRVWLQLNCLSQPEKSLTYFVAAIIIQCFRQLTTLPGVQITTMMEAFPKILQTIESDDVANTILWLYEKAPPKEKIENNYHMKNEENEKPVKRSGFKYFETKWTGPCETVQNS